MTDTRPVRAFACAFEAIVSVSEPSPWPEVGDTWSHVASLDAVQLHSRAALTVTFARPPAADTVGADEARVVWQRNAAGPVSSLTLVAPQAMVRSASPAEMLE